MSGKNNIFGLIADWVGTSYHQRLLNGASDWCRARSINLLVFITGRLGSSLESEFCRNAVFRLLDAPEIDGLALSSASVANLSGIDALAQLLAGLPERPLVSIGAALADHLWIGVDEAAGFSQLMGHLVSHHGYRRIAFIKGPEANPEARRRYQAFMACLESAGLQLDERLIFQGDFRLASGRDAGLYFSRLGDAWDVVVAANDLMAVGAREILGDKAPITGFDNFEAGQQVQLTTIDPHPYRQTQRAMAMLAELVAGTGQRGGGRVAEVPDFLQRQSCGCSGPASPAQSASENASQELWLERTTDLGERILAANDLAELEECLQACLPPAGIRFWRIIPLDAPLSSGALPEGRLMPAAWSRGPEMREIVVQALFINRNFYGYGLFDMSRRDWAQLEWLRHQISLVMHTWRRRSEGSVERAEMRQEIETISQRERDLARLVAELPLWIIELDQRLRVRYCNHAMEELTGLSEAEWRHRDLPGLLLQVDAAAVESQIREVRKNGQRCQSEFRFVGADDRPVPVFCEIQALAEDGSECLAARYGGFRFAGGVRLSGLNLKPILNSALKPEDLFYHHYHFTEREKETILAMIKGLEIRDISRSLGISENTVKGYMHAIYIKTGVNSKKEFFRVLREYQTAHVGPKSFFQSLLSSMMQD